MSQQVPFGSAGGSPPRLHSNLPVSFPPIPCAPVSTEALPFPAFLPASLAFFSLNNSDVDCSQGAYRLLPWLLFVAGDRKREELIQRRYGRWRIILEGALPSSQAQVPLPEMPQHMQHRRTGRQRSPFKDESIEQNDQKKYSTSFFFFNMLFQISFSDKVVDIEILVYIHFNKE